MEPQFFQSLLIALIVGFASGGIGAFIIIKRMALVGDAFSHVALPGIALALLYNIDPWWGVMSFLLIGAFIVWWLEGKTALPAEGLVGILFVASLATGILMIPDTEIIESLFGEFPLLSSLTLILFLGFAGVLAFLSYFLARRFIFIAVSEELASVNEIGNQYHLLFLIIFAFIVSLGIKLVGTLLMGALTIIPPLIAKNIGQTMKTYIVLSSAFGAAIAAGGAGFARYYGFLPGPTIVLLGVFVFIFSLLFTKTHFRERKHL
ncbi:MAG: metal ABC transporter permease [Candidatus Niyogibacteria bacterium]|nr:metal ABC transporter permease [Candidatus Niyogibacteria bacterium]